MPRKKSSKVKVVRKISRKKPRSKSDILEQRIKHFEEEVGTLGEKFEKSVDRESEKCEDWFHRTFGLIGPLISGIFGLLILALCIWLLAFMNLQIGSNILSGIHLFLLTNTGLFFLIFLFFSYTSYFSRVYSKSYTPFSPIVTAFSITIGFWVVARAINIVGLYERAFVFSNIAFHIEKNLFWIFWFFLLLGYFVFLIKISSGESIEKMEKNIMVKKSSKGKVGGKEIRRIYRSGEEKILGGVCGGIAEYLGVDPVIIRLLWVLGSLAWGAGILVYIIAWIIIPRNPKHKWKD